MFTVCNIALANCTYMFQEDNIICKNVISYKVVCIFAVWYSDNTSSDSECESFDAFANTFIEVEDSDYAGHGHSICIPESLSEVHASNLSLKKNRMLFLKKFLSRLFNAKLKIV